MELTYYSSAYRFNQQWIPLEELVDTDLMISHHYDVLWPAENGGYWYLGNERSDGLSFSERLAQLTGDYDPRSSWAWFYREKRTLKRLSFPLLLFFLPACCGPGGTLSWRTIVVQRNALYFNSVSVAAVVLPHMVLGDDGLVLKEAL